MPDSPAALLLDGLNPPQRDAVGSTDGPLLVIAGAGSGKTRVITRRIAYLIEHLGVNPWEIFATTFTNKAAREMKERVARLCRATDTARLRIDTFHSQCARILRAEPEAAGLSTRYTICDETDQRALMRDCLAALDIKTKSITPAGVLEAISLAKMQLLEGSEAEDLIVRLRDERYAEAYRLYQKRLRDSDAVDFDDLLLLVVKIWTENADIAERYRKRYRYLMVDEYQDTNLAQFQFVRLLAGDPPNVCVVGDEDQSIYSWRGADIRNLLDFQEHFPGARLIRLEQNYRSTRNILRVADAVISRNTQRLGKTLWSAAPQGDPIVYIEASDERREARAVADQALSAHAAGIPFEEIAVFYRANALSRVFEEALRDMNIPYRVVGGVRFYDRAEIKDILAYMQVVANPGAAVALSRILNTPRRGIGQSARGKLLDHADNSRLCLFEVLMEEKEVAAAGLKGRAAKGAAELVELVVEWTRKAPDWSLRELAENILADTQYVENLGDEKSIEVMSRKENIGEFLGALEDYQIENPDAKLQDFLESVALRDTQDEAQGPGGVSLMTIHNAKGLEFDVVFIVALERGIFPNARAVREQQHNEEERRLFYVGLTRARKRVYVSHATKRRLYGRTEWPAPSIFLREIPANLRVRLGEAPLEPLTPGPLPMNEDASQDRPSPQSSPPPSGAVASPRTARHPILGTVEIIGEIDTPTGARIKVRDAKGNTHTLMAAHSALQFTQPQTDPGPQPNSGDDNAMPF